MCNNMDGPGDYHTQWGKEDKHHDTTHRWSLKNATNELIYKKKSHRWRKQTYGYQGGKEGRDKLGGWD